MRQGMPPSASRGNLSEESVPDLCIGQRQSRVRENSPLSVKTSAGPVRSVAASETLLRKLGFRQVVCRNGISLCRATTSTRLPRRTGITKSTRRPARICLSDAQILASMPAATAPYRQQNGSMRNPMAAPIAHANAIPARAAQLSSDAPPRNMPGRCLLSAKSLPDGNPTAARLAALKSPTTL